VPVPRGRRDSVRCAARDDPLPGSLLPLGAPSTPTRRPRGPQRGAHVICQGLAVGSGGPRAGHATRTGVGRMRPLSPGRTTRQQHSMGRCPRGMLTWRDARVSRACGVLNAVYAVGLCLEFAFREASLCGRFRHPIFFLKF